MLNKLIIIFALITLNGCGSSVEVVHKPHTLIDIKNAVRIDAPWSKGVGNPDNRQLQRISPYFVNDRIYTVDIFGEFNAMTVSGDLLWNEQFNYQTSSVIANDKLIIITTIDGHILALSAIDFSQKWLINLGTEILTNALFVDNKVLVRSSLGKISALSSFDGSTQWTYQQASPVLSSRGNAKMILDNNKVIVGFDNGYISVINPVNGKVFWEKLVSITEGQTELDRINDIDAQLLVSNGYVYFIGADKYLNKYNISTAERVWRVKQSTNTGIADNKSLLFITDESSNIVAISKDSGIEVWKQKQLSYRSITMPSVLAKQLLVGDSSGYAHLISTNSGKILGRRFIDSYGINVAAINDKKQFYVQSLGSYLTALSPVNQ